eukprot:8559815-Pyramimonas_sp.AAC.1
MGVTTPEFTSMPISSQGLLNGASRPHSRFGVRPSDPSRVQARGTRGGGTAQSITAHHVNFEPSPHATSRRPGGGATVITRFQS